MVAAELLGLHDGSFACGVELGQQESVGPPFRRILHQRLWQAHHVDMQSHDDPPTR